VEALENRCLMSTLTAVDEVSLRAAVQKAHNGDVIQLKTSLGPTITLKGGEIVIDKNVTIKGPGADQLTLAGSGDRVFEIAAGVVTIRGVTIQGGEAPATANAPSGQGGGILNHANLTLVDDVIAYNTAAGIQGADGQGGGIYNDATLSMTNVQFTGNGAQGGDGEHAGGVGAGGAVYNAHGSVTISNCSFDNNTARGGAATGNSTDSGIAGNGVGGALDNDDGSVQIGDSTLRLNAAIGGGNANPGGTVGSGLGGAIANHNFGNLFAARDTIEENLALAAANSESYDAANQVAGIALGGGILSTSGIFVVQDGSLQGNLAHGGNGGLGASGGKAEGGGIACTGGEFGLLSAIVQGNSAYGGNGDVAGFSRDAGGDALGGGAYVFNARFDVQGVVFDSNTAQGGVGNPGGSAQGGAFYLAGYKRSYTLEAQFRNNSAIGGDGSVILFFTHQGGDGGAGQGGAVFLSNGTVSMSRSSLLKGNTAQGGDGGSIAEGGPGGTGGNGQGGAIYVAAATVKSNASHIDSNQAVGGRGGDGGHGTVDHLTGFTGGAGGRAEGGGMWSSAGHLQLRGTSLQYNVTKGGAGGAGGAGVGSDLEYRGVADSFAPSGPGGAGGAAQGGGLFTGGSATLTGVALAGNVAKGGRGGDSESGPTIAVNAVVVDGAAGAGGTGGDGSGAGLAVAGGTATLTRCFFITNTAIGGSGGEGAPDNGFSFHNASRGGGGGVGGYGGQAGGAGLKAVGATITLSLALFSGNTATGGSGAAGGGSGAAAGGLGGNGGGAGGAAIESFSSTIALTDSQLTQNVATGGNGAPAGPSLTQPPNAVADGRGGQAGGGALFLLDGSFAGSRATMDNNQAHGGDAANSGGAAEGAGGAVFTYSGILNLTNVTVGNNQVTGDHGGEGGGLFNLNGTVRLTNDTIAGNNAGIGGGVDFQQLTLTNTLIAANTATTDPDVHAMSGAAVNDQGHNLIGNTAASPSFFSGPSDLLGTPAKPIAPKLSPLAYFGGAQQTAWGQTFQLLTFALLPGSPAINGGAVAIDPITGKHVITDERGTHRPVGGSPDIGAFEYLLILHLTQFIFG
jgi:hypothetical protein